MSDFAALKRQRTAKETRSFVATSNSYSGPPTSSSNAAQPSSSSTSDSAPIEDTTAKMDIDEADAPTAASVSLDCNGLYASIPPSLDVRESKERGRGMYSKYARRPGDVLLSVKPHVAALSTKNLEEYCSSCFGVKKSSLQRCTSCKVVYYCDSKCQTKDWAFHKHECTAIQRWFASAQNSESGAPVIPADAIRCLARIVWRKQKLGLDSVWAREIDALQSHRSSLSKDPNSQDSQMYAQLAHALVNFLGLTSPQDMAEYGMQSAADLVDLISRLTTNTFTISTPALEPLGACVSPSIALINHSCDPNAVVVFPRAGGGARKGDEPLMQVIALNHIAPNEEILTSYIDTTLPREKRQKILKETYHFTCNCNLCVPAPNAPVDLREAMWCPKKCGGVCPLPTEENSFTRCSRCKAPVKDTDAVLDAVRVGQEALDKAEALQITNPEKSIQLTTKLIPILISAGLVLGSHPLLALARLNSSLLITHLPSVSDPNIEEIVSPGVQSQSQTESAGQQHSHSLTGRKKAQEALDEAIRAATRASTGLSQVLVEGHPVRGVALAELGKLLSVDEPDPAHARAPEESGAGQETSSPSPPTPTSKSNIAAPTPYPPSGPPRLKLAYETLLRAREELVVGFGGAKNEGGEVGQSVRALLVDLEQEMAVWKTGDGQQLPIASVKRLDGKPNLLRVVLLSFEDGVRDSAGDKYAVIRFPGSYEEAVSSVTRTLGQHLQNAATYGFDILCPVINNQDEWIWGEADIADWSLVVEEAVQSGKALGFRERGALQSKIPGSEAHFIQGPLFLTYGTTSFGLTTWTKTGLEKDAIDRPVSYLDAIASIKAAARRQASPWYYSLAGKYLDNSKFRFHYFVSNSRPGAPTTDCSIAFPPSAYSDDNVWRASLPKPHEILGFTLL